MVLNVGVNVIEVDGRASPAIQPAATSIAAFIGLTERGVPNQTVQVFGLDTFLERFGSHRADGYLAHAVEGFLQNGGAEAHVTRVVPAGSAAANRTLTDRQGAPGATTLRVTAGYRGQPDPGPWGNRICVDVRDDPRGRTTLTGANLAAGAVSAQLASVAGVRAGSVVRFVEGVNVEYRRVQTVTPATRTITWTGGLVTAGGFSVGGTVVTTAEFRLVVLYQRTPTAELAVVEEWGFLTMEADQPDYAVSRINHPTTGSRFIAVADLSGDPAAGGAPSGVENPAVAANQALTGGTEAAVSTLTAGDFVGTAALRTGLFAFDTAQVQLLAVPDAHLLADPIRNAVVRGAIDYCALRGDCMFVGSAPNRAASVAVPRVLSDYTERESVYATRIKGYAALFQAAKVYGALYAPWIQVIDPAAAGPNPGRFIPADGHVMGVYARTDRERGIWKAPAGTSALVRGALAAAAEFTDAQHTDLVRNGFVNGIRPTRGAGIVIAASRTLSTDPRWWYVNIRLLFNFVKVSLRDGLRFVRQEPHSEALRRTVKFNVVTPFLLGLWRRGAFGSGPADAVFTVKCDAENNPPAEVQLGNFRIEVYFYPVRPAETVVIVVGQQDSGATAAEA
jgi:phage tail sheath protein FI